MVTKTVRKTQAGHVAYGVEKCVQDFDGKPETKHHLEDSGMYGLISK
jgi:hypothetical protein